MFVQFQPGINWMLNMQFNSLGLSSSLVLLQW